MSATSRDETSAATGETEQSPVLVFLSEPSHWPGRPARVERIDTHGAIVFLAGDEVLKVKRAVRLPYLDFSTLAARRRFAEREVAINQPHAPQIYLGLVAVTREAGGNLRLGGGGEVVEWAVRMRRFAEADLLSCVASRGGLTREIALGLADMVARYHGLAPAAEAASDGLDGVARQIVEALSRAPDARIIAAAEALETLLQRQLARSATIRARRAAAGCIRRCHGDLHLANIVLWHGQPTPFDAIEFDERLATIDTLYDLAFLIMDMERCSGHAAANLVLARYLWRSGEDIDVEGLAALPLFLGLRAGIRAMVALDRARIGGGLNEERLIAHVEETLGLANRCLAPASPRLIAVGGLSGTGKTVLAEALAPRFGAVPGALHLRTDLERKRLAGVEELERLATTSYTAAASEAVYERVLRRAMLALAAGHSVIVDGVFAKPDERERVARLARELHARFDAVWLHAPAEALRERVTARTGDASDATTQVVSLQAGLDTGVIDWHRVDASRGPMEVLAQACGDLEI